MLVNEESTIRKCTDCKKSLPLSSFYQQPKGDGYEVRCKSCKNKRTTEKRRQKKQGEMEEVEETVTVASEMGSLEWYEYQLNQVEKDIVLTRRAKNWSAISNLYTKAQQFREKYDSLLLEKRKAEAVYEDMPDEYVLKEIREMLEELPEELAEQVQSLIKEENE